MSQTDNAPSNVHSSSEGGQIASTQVVITIDGGVARIALDGVKTRNALDEHSAAALVNACDRADADSSVGVVVIEGRHGAFCSGAARHVLAGLGNLDTATAYERLTRLYQAFARVRDLTVPTIAVVDGAAVGAGLNLAMVADVRLATPRARFISGFAANRIHPGGGHLHLLERGVNRQAAAAMGMFARTLNGIEAQAVGLVWQTVAEDEVNAILESYTAPHTSDPQLARAIKSSLNLTTSSTNTWPAATEVERARQMWSLTRGRTITKAGPA